MIKTYIEEKQELVKRTIPDSIICNKCGREFKYDHYDNGYKTFHNYSENSQMEFHHYEDVGGYYSLIGDFIEFKFDICDKCMIEFMTTFKIAPEFRDTDAHLDDDWDAQKHYEELLLKKREEFM